MRKRILQVTFAAAFATVALVAYTRYSTRESMAQAATHLLNSLTDEDRKSVV